MKNSCCQQRIGVNNDTILILYGDFNNWFVSFAFWVFKSYEYNSTQIMNGGRKNGQKKIDNKTLNSQMSLRGYMNRRVYFQRKRLLHIVVQVKDLHTDALF